MNLTANLTLLIYPGERLHLPPRPVQGAEGSAGPAGRERGRLRRSRARVLARVHGGRRPASLRTARRSQRK